MGFRPILLDLSGVLLCWFENSDALSTMNLLLQMCHGISSPYSLDCEK